MINKHMIVLLCLFALPVALAAAAPAAPAGEVLATVPGDVLSMAPRDGGGVILLLPGRKLLALDARGRATPIALPPLPDGKPGDEFTDLAVQGSKVTLSRFAVAKLYVFDFKSPRDYTVVAPTGLPGKEPRIVGLDVSGGVPSLVDAGDRRFRLGAGGAVEPLPARCLGVFDPAGKPLVFEGPRIADGRNRWRLAAGGGKTVLERVATDAAHNILNLGVLGYDKAGRLLFFEVTGAGELNNVFTLHAAKDGRVVASQVIEPQGETAAMKQNVLLADGSVCLLRKGPQPGQHRLIVVRLP